MSQITTHVLDTSRGRPARGVSVRLERREKGGEFRELAKGKTDSDGRLADLLPARQKLKSGEYRLTFDTGAYFKAADVPFFYPSVSIVFDVHSPDHYHVPLLVSPFGYSTYRGS